MIRLVLADDHRVVREGLRWMLEDDPDIEVVGEAADGAELLELVATGDCDVALVDVRMPGITGLEALEEIATRGYGVNVIVLSMHDDAAYVKRAVELGAAGYLLKSAGRDEIVRAIKTVAAGGAYVQGEVAGPLVRTAIGADDEEVRLSGRETEVLQLAADGLENKQIARRLGIGEATVKTHLGSAYERLGAAGRAEAVAIALRLELIH